MKVVLEPYDGQWAGHPEIVYFISRFPDYVNGAKLVIKQRLGLDPPNTTVRVKLVDGLGSIPMLEPTGSARGDTIHISSNAIVNSFMGYTHVKKVLAHELVHVYMNHYGRTRYTFAPTWKREGIALWTSGQTDLKDFVKVPPKHRNNRWMSYLTYYTRFRQHTQDNGMDAVLAGML